MRPVLFFLVVLSTLLAVLYFFVEKDDYRRQKIEFPDRDWDSSVDEGANTVELPFYNTKRGRLEFVLSGELDDALIQDVRDIGEFEQGVLYNGEIEIPIYEDMARDLPASGDQRPSFFRLEFNRAEYQIDEDENGKRRQFIDLLDGGTGTSDDGTLIQFEEMSIRIEDVMSKKVFFIASSLPVSISNEMITIESAKGMTGKFEEDRKLENVLFQPPVSAFVNSRSARFLSLAEDDKKSETTTEDPKSPEDVALVAITCEGALRFDRAPDIANGEENDKEVAEQTILLEKDVRIFQLDERVPGEWPTPTDTWFHCQRLEISIDRAEEGAPPTIREAVATWPGGRVLAAHQSLRADGEKLTWNETEARLTGHPTFKEEHFETTCKEALFKLDEDLVVLDGDVRGNFALRFERSEAGEDSSSAGDDSEKEPKEYPTHMEFEADHAEIYVQESGKSDSAARKRGRGERGVHERARQALSSVRRFSAWADEDDGLVIRSQDGAFVLRGRRFVYDEEADTVTLEGGLAKRPVFEHGTSRGEARIIELLLDQHLLRLVDHVDVQLQVRGDEDKDARPIPVSDPPRLPAGDARYVRIEADVMDVALDFDGRAMLWAEARASEGRSVRLSPASGGDGDAVYRVEGPVLHWDHVEELATLAAPGDDPALFPRIEFDTGRLRARRILFKRDEWKATLEQGVEITSVVGDASDASGDQPFRFTCNRAEVEFFEGLKPLGDDPEHRLRSVRKLHAWRSADSPMTIEGPSFSARGDEATWSSATSELKLFGERQQEFRRRDGKREDILRADEITFLRAKNRLELRRNVSGRIRQPESRAVRALRDGEDRAVGEGTSRTLEWKFETDILDVELRENPQGTGLTVDNLQAFQRVQLVCAQKGIQLHGDDLVYHADRQELRIFSSDDRFQTLKRVHEYDNESGQVRALTDEIHARKIRLLYFRTEPLPGDDQQTTTEVDVRFSEDVTAVFHNVGGSKRPPLGAGESGGTVQVWKFRSDRLHLRLMPRVLGRGEIQSAFAVGNVDISCADPQASAKCSEASYSEADKLLILRGDAESKVYLKYGDEVYSGDEYVEIQRLGTEEFRVHTKTRR